MCVLCICFPALSLISFSLCAFLSLFGHHLCLHCEICYCFGLEIYQNWNKKYLAMIIIVGWFAFQDISAEEEERVSNDEIYEDESEFDDSVIDPNYVPDLNDVCRPAAKLK